MSGLAEWLESKRQELRLSHRGFARYLGITHTMWGRARLGGVTQHGLIKAACRRFPTEHATICRLLALEPDDPSDSERSA